MFGNESSYRILIYDSFLGYCIILLVVVHWMGTEILGVDFNYSRTVEDIDVE